MNTEVVAGDGKIAVVGPDGWRGTIDADQLDAAAKMGYRPESPVEHHEAVLDKQYGDAPITAGLEGAARGATFGLSDALLPGVGVSREGLAERKNRNPIAAGVGEAAGFLAPALLTGGGGLAAKVGGAAGKAAAEGLAGLGLESGLLARAGAAAARTGAEGGLMGLGQGISDVALAKDPMSAEAIVGSLGGHAALGVGLGLAAGAGAEGLASALKTGGSAIARYASKASEGLTDASSKLTPDALAIFKAPEIQGADKAALSTLREAEVGQLEAARDSQRAVIANDIQSFREGYRDFGMRLNAQLPKGEGLGRQVNAAERRLENVVGNMKSLADDPGKALDALQRQEQILKTVQEKLPSGTLDETLAKNTDLQAKIASVTGDVQSPRLDAIDARLDQLANPPKAGLLEKGVGMLVGHGLVGHFIPGGGILGALAGRELADAAKGAAGYLTRKLVGAFAEKASALADGATNLLSKIAPPKSAMAALGDFATAVGGTAGGAYSRAAKAISDAAANPDQTRAAIHDSLSGMRVTQPELADQVETGLVNKLQFLAGKVPKQPDTTANLLDPKSWNPNDAAQVQFARYVAAANDPLRIVDELRAQSVAKETMEVMQALYPQMLGRLQQNIAQQLAKPEVAAKVPYPMRIQLAKVLGQPTDGTLRPAFVTRVQQVFSQQPKPVKPPERAPAQQEDTMAQRFAGG